jgi:hypothetical protein
MIWVRPRDRPALLACNHWVADCSPAGAKNTLITWELWKERNARIFNNKASMPMAVVENIKEESKNWIFAGAKHLADIIS